MVFCGGWSAHMVVAEDYHDGHLVWWRRLVRQQAREFFVSTRRGLEFEAVMAATVLGSGLIHLVHLHTCQFASAATVVQQALAK